VIGPTASTLFWWLAKLDTADLRDIRFREMLERVEFMGATRVGDVVAALRELELADLVVFILDLEGVREVSVVATPRQLRALRSIFVVHGHDRQLLAEVDALIQRVGLIPIVLQVLASSGRTLIEKIEENSEVPFAVCLLTPDDVGAPVDTPSQLRPRARQNVILELGYFIGRLGRQHVHVLHKGDIELPSDYHGVLYTAIDAPNKDWRIELCKELRAAGIPAAIDNLFG